MHRKAKDLLRAPRVGRPAPNQRPRGQGPGKGQHGELLSPVLFVRGDASCAAPLLVADGYHRICASYDLDEDADIPCRLADRPHTSNRHRVYGRRQGVAAPPAGAMPAPGPLGGCADRVEAGGHLASDEG